MLVDLTEDQIWMTIGHCGFPAEKKMELAKLLSADYQGRLLADPCSGLTDAQILELVPEVSKHYKGRVAVERHLPTKERIALAMEAGWGARKELACCCYDLTWREVKKLVEGMRPDWKGVVAREARNLTGKQRLTLALESTPTACGMLTWHHKMTRSQRFKLFMNSTKKWKRHALTWRHCFHFTKEQVEALRAKSR